MLKTRNTLKPLVEFYKTHKWGQGMHLNSGTYCLVEARVHLGLFMDSQENMELHRRCRGGVLAFNDTPGRTFKEVMEMLKQNDAA